MTAVAASAGVTGTISYDYDRATGNPWQSSHQAVTSLKYDLPGVLGAVDAGVVGYQLVTNTRANAIGYDFGYSNGFAVGPVNLVGRVSYRSVSTGPLELKNDVGTFTADKARQNTVRLGVEASMKVTQAVTGFVGYEHSKVDNASTNGVFQGIQQAYLLDTSANRYTIGAQYALTPKLSVRAGYASMSRQGRRSNGLTSAVSYAF